MSRRVAVLMGGWSAEREVSLVTGERCADALGAGGHLVTCIDVDRDIAHRLRVLDPPPEVVFNALHGRFGEDGCVQGLLETMGLPLHPFGSAGVGPGHGQADGQALLRFRRHSLPRGTYGAPYGGRPALPTGRSPLS